jgi:hypothetical protein
MDARARGNEGYQTFNQAGIRARGRPARCLVYCARTLAQPWVGPRRDHTQSKHGLASIG